MILDDIDRALPLMKRSFKKNIKPYTMTWHEKSTRDTAVVLISKGISFYNEANDSEIDAIISGMIIPSMFDKSTILAQILIWYTEAQSGVGVKLLKMFEREAKIRGAHIVMFGSPAEIVRENHKVYTRLGYKGIEAQYIKEL